MSEKGIFSPFERLGHGLWELALGIGAAALSLTFLKKSVESAKSSKKGKKEG